MSVSQVLTWLSQYQLFVLAYLLSVPLLIFLLGIGYKKQAKRQFRDYLCSVFIYGITIPGIFSITMLLYSFLFLKSNLLQTNAVLYFLPWISMFFTFWLTKRYTNLTGLPGFGRLSGLMLMMALVFLCLFVLYRMRFIVGFFASFETLLVVGICIFFGIKYAASKMSGKQ